MEYGEVRWGYGTVTVGVRYGDGQGMVGDANGLNSLEILLQLYFLIK